MIQGVHHTCITVSDLERSIAFYCDTLGLKLIMTEESERSGDDRSKALGVARAKVKLAILQAGDARVELIEYVTAGGRPYDRNNNDVGAMHIAFQLFRPGWCLAGDYPADVVSLSRPGRGLGKGEALT
ncbi:MAG: VOC family protein [Anaerolineae bacterium]